MSPEAQRIAIAEECGHIITDHERLTPEQWKTWYEDVKGICPDYLNDLNAMHEAEKALQDGCKYWPDYVDELVRLVSDAYPRLPHQKREGNWSQTVHATAAQRAEAYLRTIGKWKD